MGGGVEFKRHHFKFPLRPLADILKYDANDCHNNYYLGLMMALEIPFIIGMIFCPESPRWLFTKGNRYIIYWILHQIFM